MELEEYLKELKLLENSFKKAKLELVKKFALSRNIIKKGCLIEDHIGKVLVDKITIVLDQNGVPHCNYYGTSYTKQGKPRKDGEKRNIYQANVVKVHK